MREITQNSKLKILIVKQQENINSLNFEISNSMIRPIKKIWLLKQAIWYLKYVLCIESQVTEESLSSDELKIKVMYGRIELQTSDYSNE